MPREFNHKNQFQSVTDPATLVPTPEYLAEQAAAELAAEQAEAQQPSKK